MISVIICSRTQNISNVLYENIKGTIGCEYELLIIDNSKNQYSIFEAYNIGIEKSKGENLCFIHDDILLHTQDWGLAIVHIFANNLKIGLIGVAGAKSKTKMPSGWWDCQENQKVIHIIQHFPNNEKEKMMTGFENNSNTEVVVIDGVFMAARKTDKIRFNKAMTSFHNYDLNISFEYLKNGYKILVTNEILVAHFSAGSLNKAWYESSSTFHKLYKNYLPIDISRQVNNVESNKTEFNLGLSFITKLIEHKLYWDAIYWWFEIFKLKPIAKYHYRFWKRMLKNVIC